MPNLITINNTILEHITYKDKPVVTMAMIADVHGVSVKIIDNAFRRNKKRFIEKQDYARLDFAEANQLPLKEGVSPNGINVFTEDGYLLLVKPLRDDVSWDVQRRMRDAYFRVQSATALPSFHNPQTKMLVETLMRVDTLEAKQDQDRQIMLATQSQQITQQHEIITAQHDIIQAKELALVALRSQSWMTIRQYVYLHRDLQSLMPEETQKAFALHIGTICRERGAPMYKALTADTIWPDERTYPIGVIDEILANWLGRRASQITLLRPPDEGRKNA